MPPVTILEDATRAITQGFNETPPVGSGGRPIPLLVWSSRSYSDDKSGNRTELGPMFLFCWTNDSEIDQNKYLIANVGDRKLALAPSAIFQSGSHRIEQIDDRLTLVDD
jgi:hypothetical protein